MQICLDQHTEFSLIQNLLAHLMLPVQDPLERTKDASEEMPVQSKITLNGTKDITSL